MIYFISDHHFFHHNIIKYTNRPFNGLSQMHKVMIENWNSVVKEDDTVVHGGDFGLGGKDKLKEILSQLNGYKILVKGNHDSSARRMLNAGFNEVVKYWSDDKIFVFHNPSNLTPFFYEKYKKCDIYLYGHVHQKTHPIKKGFNICVEHLDFTPISYDEVILRTESIYKRILRRFKDKVIFI